MLETIDVNSDLGEHYGVWRLSNDADLLPIVTSANIPTGFHAGDPLSLEQTLSLAIAHGVAIGAHISYPDLQGFGRRPMRMSYEELRASTVYQIGALQSLAHSLGGTLSYVKPHGALYNAMDDPQVVDAVTDGLIAVAPQFTLLCLSGSEAAHTASQKGLRVAHEVFADRHYNADGTLVSRMQPHALITSESEIVARVTQLVVEQTITAQDGSVLALPADSICVHGDTPDALNITQTVLRTLQQHRVPLASFVERT